MPGQATDKVKESTMFEVNDMSMDGTMFERGEEEDEGDQKMPTAPAKTKKGQTNAKTSGAKVAEMEESFQSVHDAMHSQASSAQVASARGSAMSSNKSKVKSQASASKSKPPKTASKKVSAASKRSAALESGFGGMAANKEADLKTS